MKNKAPPAIDKHPYIQTIAGSRYLWQPEIVDSVILLLQEIKAREPIELGRISRNAEIEIGREPTGSGIVVASEAVSRIHGKISALGNYWFYEDLGSTNGSWINGESVQQGMRRFLRSGDTLQLASTIIQVTELGEDGAPLVARSQHLPGKSLLVFLNDRLVGEFPVPEYGQALAIGGPGADLQIEGMMLNEPSLVVERKGMHTTARRGSRDLEVQADGVPIDGAVTIRDGCEIAVGRYRIYYNEPVPSSDTQSTLALDQGDWSSLARKGERPDSPMREEFSSGFLNKPSHGALFGRPPEDFGSEDEPEAQDTLRMQPLLNAKTFGRDSHPAMRNSSGAGGFSFDTMEEKVVLIVALALVLALVALLTLWLMA